MKGEEEEEAVDQVVVVEVGLVLANRATEAQAAIEAVAIEAPVAAALLALCSTLERRSRKPTLILSHPTPNNNLEDPIQVSRGTVIFCKLILNIELILSFLCRNTNTNSQSSYPKQQIGSNTPVQRY